MDIEQFKSGIITLNEARASLGLMSSGKNEKKGNAMKLLRLPAVLELVPYSKSSIYAMIERGEFVKPVKIGARAIAFPEDEVSAWIAAKIDARR